MIEVNAEKYAAAQRLIRTGTWRVDAEAGLIFGRRGRPLERRDTLGYVCPEFRHPDTGQPTKVSAHRVIWEYVNGQLREGLFINHLNGVKADNRIANLEAVVHQENMRHAVATRLHGCRDILTAEQAMEIYRRMWAADVTSIAREFGVSKDLISAIKHGRSWADVTGHLRGEDGKPRR